MNRFSLTLTLLVSGSLTTAFAQVDYRPGYVVSLQGDTLRGTIDYRNWLRNPKTIAFQSSTQGGERKFKPLEIRAFGVGGDLYESAIVQVDVSPTSVGELSESPEPQLVADTAFIRALITGEKSLYVYHSTQQHGNLDQYYIRKDAQWELLVYKKYVRKHAGAGGQDFITANTRYVNQLAFYLQGCPSIQKKMNTLRYTGASLERLFHAYYDCTTAKPAYQKKTEKQPIEFGVLAGGVHTSIKFDVAKLQNQPMLPYSRTSLSSDFTFTGGVFLDIIRQRNNHKWSLNNELVYTSFASEGMYYTENNSENYYNTYSKLEFSYVKLNTMVRFKYPVGKLFIFANVGISASKMLKDENTLTVVRYTHGTTTITEDELFDNGVKTFDLGILGGLGLRYQRFAFEARYESTQGMLDYAAVKAPLHRTAFLLSYRISK